MEYVVTFAIALVGSVLMFELYAWLDEICVWLTKRAASRMPGKLSERYTEEWLAYLSEMPNSLVKLTAVGGFWKAVAKLRFPRFFAVVLCRRIAAPLMRLQYFRLKKYMKSGLPALEEVRTNLIADGAPSNHIQAIVETIKFFRQTLKHYARYVRRFEKAEFAHLGPIAIVRFSFATAICSTQIALITVRSRYPHLFGIWHSPRLES